MKKARTRYNKFTAYLLFSSSLAVFGFPLFISTGNSKQFLPTFIVGLIFFVLFTLINIRKTPKGERIGTWFRAWWLGLKVAFKLALCFTLILIPFVMSHKSKISEKDYYFWEDGDVVRGDDGREFTVCGGGSFVNVNGNWQKIYTLNGEPYFEDGLNKIWLSDRR